MMQDYQQEFSAIRNLLRENPGGMSVTDISRALQKNKNTVGRYLDILLISGQVEMRTYGMAKVYTLSQRVPFSAMLSYSKELIMVLDAGNRIVDVNENFLKALRLDRSGVVGKNIEYLLSPEIDIHDLLMSIAAGNGESDTVTFQPKGEGERIFRIKHIPTVFEDGGKGMTVVLDDITKQILAEREIRQSEERFRMMADNIQDGLIIIENGKIVYANKRISEITGYSIKELWMMKPIAIIASEDQKKAEEHRRAVEMHPEKPRGLQICIIRKDGERRFVYSRVSGVRHHDRFYNFVVFTDITDHRLQEARIAESEQRFRMMAENIRDGLLIIENNKIVFANRRMTEIVGYTQEEIGELDFRKILSADVPPPPELATVASSRGRCTLEEAISTIRPGADLPWETTFWIRRKDGTKRCIQGNFSAAERDGILSIYITATDITSFAEKEKALRDRIASLQELVS
ncbi:MAG TPA: PAS domain S-box protein [Methanoregulaceae archaeon]|nr:PAS domain S-box protein [Methanoregulaceae archaeon]HRY75130.1 PAS domain S-box protein [Methanoregulaceae archaeon]